MPILTCCCCANAGTSVAKSAKAAIRLRSTMHGTCSTNSIATARDYNSGYPFRGSRQEEFAEPLAARHSRAQVEAVDDGEAKTARRHGVLLRRAVLVKSDLDAGHSRYRFDVVDQRRRRMPIAAPVRSEQHDAITLAAIVVGKIPFLPLVKCDYRVDPTRAVEIGPLVGKPQMRLDDGRADGFEIEHAAIARKISPHPFAATLFDPGIRFGMQDPVIEGALARRFAGGVPPPARLAVDDGNVGRDMPAVEQRHPEVAGRVMLKVIGFRIKHAAADAHA